MANRLNFYKTLIFVENKQNLYIFHFTSSGVAGLEFEEGDL